MRVTEIERKHMPWVGMELEYNTGSISDMRTKLQTLLEADRAAGTLPNIAWVRSGWNVVSDPSIGGPEVTTPPLRTFAEVAWVCDRFMPWAHDEGFRVSPRCGLHVHIGVDRLLPKERKKLIAAWMAYEHLYFMVLPRNRQRSHFCPPMRHQVYQSDLRRLVSQNPESAELRVHTQKYCALNVSPYSDKGTFEFRLGHGVDCGIHARRWVTMLLLLVRAAIHEGHPMTVEEAQAIHSRNNDPTAPCSTFTVERFIDYLGVNTHDGRIVDPVAIDAVQWFVNKLPNVASGTNDLRDVKARVACL